MEHLVQDLRVGLRALSRRPGFAAAAIITLALGIGGTTAIFSVVHAVLLRPLPYPDADRLTFLWSDLPASDYLRAPVSGNELDDLRRSSRTHEDFGAIWASTATLVEDERPQPLRVGMVTSNFLSILGREPALGRWFEDGDEGEGVPPRMVISGGLWQGRLGGDPDVIGRALRVDGGWGVPGGLYTVVGVMPSDFEMLLPLDSSVPRSVDVWLPWQHDLVADPRDSWYLRTVGRLSPGTTLAQARDEIAALGARIEAAHPEYAATGRSFYPVALHGDGVRNVRPALLALLGGTAFVLLIACANVASLLLARSAERHREISIRAALGAGRRRLARQLLTESLLLAAAGGVLGLGLAALGLELLRTLQPANLPRLGSVSINPQVLGFSFVVAMLSGLVFGLAPAWDAWRLDLEKSLRSGGRGGDRRRNRAQSLLVVAEVALAIVLLSGAGLMIHTFVRLQRVDPGFSGEGVLTFQLSLPAARYETQTDLANFTRELERRLGSLAGVDRAGAINQLPLSDLPNWSTPWKIRDAVGAGEPHEADARVVTPGYLAAVGARLVAGRFFEPSDDENGRKVVIVDEQLAREAWPSRSAIGQEIEVQLWGGHGFVDVWAEVVGVVRHLRHHDLRREVRGQMYAPFAQGPRNQVAVVVKTAGDPTSLAGPVRAEVAEIDPELALSDVQPLGHYVDGARAGARFRMILAGLLGLLALILACIGLYGVLSFSVALRGREIGVRMALGGSPGAIVRLFVGRGMRLLALGTGIGMASAVLVNGLIESLLFEVAPLDPATLLVIPLVLVTGAVAACYVPARRAGAIDPVHTLRCE